MSSPRERLLAAAQALVREGADPTTRALAQRAGVNIAAVNYYFQGKDNLLAQALDSSATADMQAWIDALEPTQSPRVRLRMLVHFLARIHRGYPHMAHAQTRALALKGRVEHATALALRTLQALCTEIGGDEARGRTQGMALMAACHYLSLFHGSYAEMTGLDVGSPAALEAWVDALIGEVVR